MYTLFNKLWFVCVLAVIGVIITFIMDAVFLAQLLFNKPSILEFLLFFFVNISYFIITLKVIEKLKEHVIIRKRNLFYPSIRESRENRENSPNNEILKEKENLIKLLKRKLSQIFRSLPKNVLNKIMDENQFTRWNDYNLIVELFYEFNLHHSLYFSYDSLNIFKPSSYQMIHLERIRVNDIQHFLNTPEEKIKVLIFLIPFKLRRYELKKRFIFNHIQKIFMFAYENQILELLDEYQFGKYDIWNLYCMYRGLENKWRNVPTFDNLSGGNYEISRKQVRNLSFHNIYRLKSISNQEIRNILDRILQPSFDLNILSGAQQIFVINDHLTVALILGETKIFVNNIFFRLCKYLLLNIPIEETEKYDSINSIDEATQYLDGSMENPWETSLIPPETEFWGHCSNLQMWAEYNYDTCLLHSNLSFPLLKILSRVGDLVAKRVFKDEIIKRIESGYPPVIQYLFEEGYFEIFNEEELESMLLILNDKAFENLEIIENHYLSKKECHYCIKKSIPDF